MKIPYITIEYSKYEHKIIVGFGLYKIGVGCVLWCRKWDDSKRIWGYLRNEQYNRKRR